MIGFDNKDRATNAYNWLFEHVDRVEAKMINGEVLYRHKRLSREEALGMYTFGAAYMQLNQRGRGSIEGGKLADLVEMI